MLVASEDAAIDLAQAALLIASLMYPDLDSAYYLSRLDALARRVREVLTLPAPSDQPQLPATLDLSVVITAMNTVLIEEEHFHGNRQDYNNPENSFLNQVLERHIGIPVTLSLLYMEVGKRVGIHFDGIGFPYHFMVRCELPSGPVYLDPFTDGRLLDEHDCVERIRRAAGRRLKIHPHLFEPISHRSMLTRMLTNLKRIYIDREDYASALSICDLLLLLNPGAAAERRDRGHIHLQLKHYSRSLRDLSAYVEQEPHAEDRHEILQHIQMIRHILAMLN